MMFHLLRKRPKEQSAAARAAEFLLNCVQWLPVLAQQLDSSGAKIRVRVVGMSSGR